MWRSIMGYYSIFDLINNNMAGNNNTQTNDASLVEPHKQETTKRINHFDYESTIILFKEKYPLTLFKPKEPLPYSTFSVVLSGLFVCI